jgi:hypothetical protein
VVVIYVGYESFTFIASSKHFLTLAVSLDSQGISFSTEVALSSSFIRLCSGQVQLLKGVSYQVFRVVFYHVWIDMDRSRPL